MKSNKTLTKASYITPLLEFMKAKYMMAFFEIRIFVHCYEVNTFPTATARFYHTFYAVTSYFEKTSSNFHCTSRLPSTFTITRSRP